MNRKQMLEEIAKQSDCSLRHVRKAVFSRAAENKRYYRKVKFSDALTDSSTNWTDYNTIPGNDKFRKENTFDVCMFPSGIVVLFNVKEKNKFGETCLCKFGVRLTTARFLCRE